MAWARNWPALAAEAVPLLLSLTVSIARSEYSHEADAVRIEFKEEQLQDVIKELIRENFEPYLTSVGGSGLGILSPYAAHRTPGALRASQGVGQVTPPDTPSPNEQIGGGAENGASNLELDPLDTPFLSTSAEELSQWAASLGRWLYVWRSSPLLVAPLA